MLPSPDMLMQTGTVLLDTTRPDDANRTSLLFTSPRRVLTAGTLEEVPAVLAAAEAALREGRHVAGFLAYEAGYAFETIAPLKPGAGALAWLGVYDAPRVLTEEEARALLAPYQDQPFSVRDARFGLRRAAYAERLRTIKDHIRAGDVYQINFTAPVHFELEGAPLALFAALRQRQRVAYGAYLNLGSIHALSLSPELFVRRAGRRVVTRPMKGTVRRGQTAQEDDALQAWLREDEKSRAENLMIVDLLRNDLSVVCEPGSVVVPRLFTTEPYETLIQMTSTVEGRLREGVGTADLLRALFPCGSVTGAPKIRAMQLIDALEEAPRGVYCGAIGFAAPDERAVFNVAIRTLVLEREEGARYRGTMGVGSGVVWDSEPEAEYDECLLKARFLVGAAPLPPFDLIETMRAEDGAVPLLALHLDRLRASARHFGYPFDEADFCQRVEAALLGHEGPRRVRATLGARGMLTVQVTEVEADPDAPWRVALYEPPIDSRDVFFYHKTTQRGVYEAAYAWAQSQGLDEALLVNERGEVTEGSRTNVFARYGSTWLTPPVESGLLGGVYRRHLLQTRPDVREGTLRPADLAAADELALANAVRGFVPARLVEV